MKFKSFPLLLVFLVSCSWAQAQPVISSVTNGASFKSAVSPGAIVTIFGTNLVAGNGAEATLRPLPTSLGGSTVLIGGSAAPLFFTSPTQINLQLPYGIAPGPATAVVQSGSVSSAPFTFMVSAASPGIFLNANQAVAVNPDGSVNSAASPALPGDYLVVYLTGVGPVDQTESTNTAPPATPVATSTLAFSATIGGQNAITPFVGLTSGFIGLGQANVQVPTLPNGSYPLIVTVGGVASAAAQVTVARSSLGSLLVSPTTPRPDGQGEFAFCGASNYPSLEGSTLVFVAGNCDSLWAMNVDTGTFVKLADTTMAAPGGSGNFSNFYDNNNTAWSVAPQIRNATVIFFARDSTTSGFGLYSIPTTGGTISRVANYLTADPSNGNRFAGVNAFDAFSFDGTRVAFDSNGVLYSANPDGTNLTVVISPTLALNSGGAFSYGLPAESFSISGNNVSAVMGNGFDFSRGINAIFTGPFTGFPSDAPPMAPFPPPHPSNVASTEQLPGNTNAGFHTEIGGIVLDGDTIFFSAQDSMGTFAGLFSASASVATSGGGPITHLFDYTSSGMMTYNFNEFSVDNGVIAFDGYSAAGVHNYFAIQNGGVFPITTFPNTCCLGRLNLHAFSNGRVVFFNNAFGQGIMIAGTAQSASQSVSE
jgi:uncharacterized protein (TIGR03437 family)